MKTSKQAGVFTLRLRHWFAVAAVLFLAGAAILFYRLGGLSPNAAQEAISWAMAGKIIVVDAGHGGADPGVVGASGLLEKDVNLAVARYLRELLRQSGAGVVFTREYDDPINSGKQADLAARSALAEESGAAAFISLHGNSFPRQPSQKGAQVFYHAGNEEGKNLAFILQEHLTAPPMESSRRALHHGSAYLLKNIEIPAVIIEMGFFSNPQEEKLLADPEYQWQLAFAIFHGIVDYFAREESPAENPPSEPMAGVGEAPPIGE